ncbi:MAG: type IV pilus secretin PilQ [Acidobacteriota bacterium]
MSAAQVRMPAEIRSLDLKGSRGLESVELMADRPLVWTSFRDSAGDLVIELPNSVPAQTVRSLESPEGLIAAVDIERVDDASRPMTRLIVKTRQPSEHSLSGEGELLRIQLATVGAAPQTSVAARSTPQPPPPPAPVRLAYEPVAEEDLAADPAPAAESVHSQASMGTPEAPVVGPPPSGVAASQLFSVDVLSRGNPTVVQISGDGEFAYSMFRLENPERFVVDLAGVVNTAGSATLPVGSDEVDQIRIGQFKPRPDPVSRVVFDLQDSAALKINRSADGLKVTFGADPAAAAMQASEPPAPEPVTVARQVAPAMDEPTLSEPEAGITEEDLAESQIAEATEPETVTFEPIEETPTYSEPGIEEPETIDVADSAMAEPAPEPAMAEPEWVAAEATSPPAQGVSSEPNDSIRIEPSAAPPVPVYQPTAPPAGSSLSRPTATSDVALFEEQQVQIDDPRLEEKEKFLQSFGTLVIDSQEKEYYGELIDMSLRKADLVETLRSFATISDLNFVIQPNVAGSVTVELKGVPWDQAMWQILKINNLGMDIDGTIVRIAPTAQLRAEAEEARRLRQIQQQSVPLQTVLKSLSYSDAEEIANLLRNRTGSILSARGTVQVDSRTNTLILRELPGTIDVVLAVIDNLDSPEPQVTIEARIIEATKTFSRSLGIEWGFEGESSNRLGNTTGLQFPNNGTVDGGVGLLTGGANGFLNLTLGNILNSFTLDAQLQVAESEGLVNLVSAPRVTTLNNNAASIQSGIQIPIQTVTNRTVSVQFVNATLQLTVTPQVTAEGTVMMEITVAKRSPQPGLAVVGATNSPISTREASTKVIVRDGGTAVIGGIYEVSANQSQDRLPGLSNIPILGHLFKNRNRTDQNDELMIFITPRIVQM